jgi:hypothetical protein
MKALWFQKLPPYRFDQTEKLWLAFIGSGIVYVGLFTFVPDFENFGWPCVWKSSTGFECLGCGFTRSCGAMARLEWKAAFTLNPLVYLIVPVLILKLAFILTSFATGKSWGKLWFYAGKRILILVAVMATAFVVCLRLSQLWGGL